MIRKEIFRYTNVELLDVIKNDTNTTRIEQAKSEYNSRNLTEVQKSKVESDYIKYQKFLKERKNKSLSTEEYLSFFFLPLLTPNRRWRDDHFTESEMNRFSKYGFEKKYKQAIKVKIMGILFWISITFVFLLFRKYFV